MRLLLLFLVLPVLLSAQRDFSDVEIKVHEIRDGLFMLEGAGGNIAVCIGDDGVLIVDSQYAGLTEKIKIAIGGLTAGPINTLVNTHFHGDHTGGNVNFGREGAQIIAHQNVKARMSVAQQRAFRPETPAAPEEARPVVTYSDEMELRFNGQDILMIHVDNAHTDGDAHIYFSGADVLHMGDTYFNQRYPYIDLDSGGSIDGMIASANAALMLATRNTVIIPGHGNLSNITELREYRDLLLFLRNEVAALLREGKNLEEIQALKPGAATDEDWGGAFINPDRMLEIIYKSLGGE